MINLYDYQKTTLNQIESILKTNKEVVLAACPSAGKTHMMMSLIINNPDKTFLVLTHGTNVLKNQWEIKFKQADIKASKSFENRVMYEIHQNAHKLTRHYDYVIVDEAHEFTFAKTAQNTLKKINPDKIIYLTGTPSKFIAKNYKCVFIAANDLIKMGYISDLYVGVFTTNADLNESDYKESSFGGDMTKSAGKKLEKTVNSDLDSLLSAIIKRLTSTITKDKPILNKMTSWSQSLGYLNKTLIACKSIKQAEKVQLYFKKQKIISLLSNSKNDPDSENIKKFIENPDVKILIVVDRAILGFDFPELINVVDMTGSHNIDRIYQLYARVMRKHENSNKYFFKLTTEINQFVTGFYMNAALLMLFKEYISQYNGKNLNKLKIPVKRARNEKNKTNIKKTDKNIFKYEPIDFELYHLVKANELLNNIYNNIDNNFNEYKYITFGEIKEKNFNLTRWIKQVTESDIDYIIKYQEFPESIYD